MITKVTSYETDSKHSCEYYCIGARRYNSLEDAKTDERRLILEKYLTKDTNQPYTSYMWKSEAKHYKDGYKEGQAEAQRNAVSKFLSFYSDIMPKLQEIDKLEIK